MMHTTHVGSGEFHAVLGTYQQIITKGAAGFLLKDLHHFDTSFIHMINSDIGFVLIPA